MILNSWRTRLWVLLFVAFISAGCTAGNDEGQPAQTSPTAPTRVDEPRDALAKVEPDGSDGVTVVIQNHGGNMEGHTPRGFQGMGTGLFVGDNLNSGFPNGDGVQVFLTFDRSEIPSGRVLSAVLRSVDATVRGTPFVDLGSIGVEEVRYDRFSPALWNLAPLSSGASCVFATSADGPFECDVTEAVQRSLDDAYPFAQFRLRLSKAGDGDGRPDMVMFFISDSNTNQPGIFEMEVTVDRS